MMNSLGLPAVQVPPYFSTWKLQQNDTNPMKRKHEEISTPLDEALPPHDETYDKIQNNIPLMFTEVTKLVEQYQSISPENAGLMKVLEQGYITPRAKPFIIAFLGEQGIGKSTILNALLGRELVTKSAGSSACTSFPTHVTYKVGAPDDTKLSDITVKMIAQAPMEDLVGYQIAHYAECYPFKPPKEQDEVSGGDGSSNSGGDSDGGSNINSSDEDEISTPSQRNRHKLPKKALRDAETAKEFFDLIFNTKTDEAARIQLEHRLGSTDIANGDDIRSGAFFQLCLEAVQRCQEQLNSVAKDWLNVSDKDLRGIRNKAQKFWPLIDFMEVSTGHTILRHNLTLMDLPGKKEPSFTLAAF
jgi:hypothetical protein